MRDVFEQIGAYGIVLVVVVNKIEDARPLAKALCDGWLPVAEVTSPKPHIRGIRFVHNIGKKKI